MFKCPHSDQCVPNLDHCTIEDPTNKNDTLCPVETSWRCTNGQCISKEFVCNHEFECEDASDEAEGCQIHKDSPCKSWRGLEHVICHNDSTVCTLPKFNEDLADCHQCDSDPSQWRCNDGWCIDKIRVNDGQADCEDRSDEESGIPNSFLNNFDTVHI